MPRQRDPRTLLAWTFIALLLLAQWQLFCAFVRREVVGFPPPYFDQTAFLTQSYQAYETFLAKGFLGGIRPILKTPSANGVLLPLQPAILPLFFGVSRSTALSLTFCY